ncbi:MAG: zinc ribbon domain-containing protein [Candidatus Woesearchaeota archaeon]
MKKYKFCQSCGMPMSKDPQKGGTEKDGSKNLKYCSYCYQNGNFTSPEIDTAKKMQAFCIEKMKEQGMPRFIAWIFTRGIPKLERWKE